MKQFIIILSIFTILAIAFVVWSYIGQMQGSQAGSINPPIVLNVQSNLYPMDTVYLENYIDYYWEITYQTYDPRTPTTPLTIHGKHQDMGSMSGLSQKTLVFDLHPYGSRGGDQRFSDILDFMIKNESIFLDHSEYDGVAPGQATIPDGSDEYLILTVHDKNLTTPNSTQSIVRGFVREGRDKPELNYLHNLLNKLTTEVIANEGIIYD